MSDGFNKLAEGLGKAIETVPELYDDGLKSTVQESGDILALIPRAIKAALLPLRKWIIEREYKLAELEKLLVKRLEHVDENKIVTPEAYVAVPAIQAISYSMNSEELRNLYANLLAKAMNSDTKDLVHPSFVEIIKQMSPLDAKVLKIIMEREYNPCVDLWYQNDKGSVQTIMTHVTALTIAPIESICLVLDNLEKQKLIEIPNRGCYVDNSVYTPIIQSDFYKSQEKLYPPSNDGFKFTYAKRMINKTNLGISFYKLCVIDE